MREFSRFWDFAILLSLLFENKSICKSLLYMYISEMSPFTVLPPFLNVFTASPFFVLISRCLPLYRFCNKKRRHPWSICNIPTYITYAIHVWILFCFLYLEVVPWVDAPGGAVCRLRFDCVQKISRRCVQCGLRCSRSSQRTGSSARVQAQAVQSGLPGGLPRAQRSHKAGPARALQRARRRRQLEFSLGKTGGCLR